MSETNDGGPAFPVTGVNHDEHYGTVRQDVYAAGVTIRDYFAAKALNGLLSYSYCCPTNGNYIENSNPERTALAAYQYADAMLKARQQ
jgi:hypothetical protein